MSNNYEQFYAKIQAELEYAAQVFLCSESSIDLLDSLYSSEIVDCAESLEHYVITEDFHRRLAWLQARLVIILPKQQ